MPYITASIIMQILGVVIPKLEQLQQEGAVGQRKITQYTRYVTMALATLQATGSGVHVRYRPGPTYSVAERTTVRSCPTGCGRGRT